MFCSAQTRAQSEEAKAFSISRRRCGFLLAIVIIVIISISIANLHRDYHHHYQYLKSGAKPDSSAGQCRHHQDDLPGKQGADEDDDEKVDGDHVDDHDDFPGEHGADEDDDEDNDDKDNHQNSVLKMK